MIKTLGKKEIDILRQSLSTMKQGWNPAQQQPQHHAQGLVKDELPEEIVDDENEAKKVESVPEQKSEPAPKKVPTEKPRPKIVCQALYTNTVSTRSQAALSPYVRP